MRTICFIALLPLLFPGCAGSGNWGARPEVVDPQCRSCVAGCLQLGMLVETADAGHPFGFWAASRMLDRLQQRAVRLRATHILWLHRTADSAAAEVFRCPAP